MSKEAELIEYAWTILADAGGGDWEKETPDWKGAAAKWRDEYFAYSKERSSKQKNVVDLSTYPEDFQEWAIRKVGVAELAMLAATCYRPTDKDELTATTADALAVARALRILYLSWRNLRES